MQMKINLNKIILTGFDLSLLLYLIAYIVFNVSGDFDDKIRLLSTSLLFGFGFLLCIIRNNKARVLKGYTVWYFIFSLFWVSICNLGVRFRSCGWSIFCFYETNYNQSFLEG